MLLNFVPNVITTNCVKFISYTGEWPNLCRGVLTLEIEGKRVTFGYADGADYPRFWESGGGLTSDYRPLGGPWEIDVQELPEQFRQYAAEIDTVFNSNVEHGCCGGCA